MLHIGLCEDDNDLRKYYHSFLTEWASSENIPVHISSYESSEQLLFSYDEKEPFDILILDIQMGGINGMELAKQLRKQDSHVQIIFLTGLKDYALEGYEVGAYRYLLKPVKEKEFSEILTKVCELAGQKKKRYMTLYYQGETRKIDYEDILYVEARGHYITLVLIDSELEWKGSLTGLVPELERNGFALVRRGMYVNLFHVSKIGRTECRIDNGEVLPVSRSTYQTLNDRVIRYYKEEV